MSDPIIALLQNSDPQQRKRGISAAAKKSDPQYLKYLARLAKSDPDEDLRKLAKKAGTYIHQQQPSQATPSAADSLDGLRASVTPEPRTPVASTPPPPTPTNDLPDLGITVTDPNREADPVQAEGHYNNAFDMHLKGDNARAVLELGTAFYLNPAYANDATAVAFAAEMTGLDRAQAVAYISDPDNWRALTDKYGGIQKRGNQGELQSLYLWLAGAILIIIVVGVVVWFFQSGILTATLEEARFGPTVAPLPTMTITPQ